MTQEVMVPVARPYPEYVDVPYANPVVQTVEKIVEVPQVQIVERVVEVPQVQYQEVIRHVTVPQVQGGDPAGDSSTGADDPEAGAVQRDCGTNGVQVLPPQRRPWEVCNNARPPRRQR